MKKRGLVFSVITAVLACSALTIDAGAADTTGLREDFASIVRGIDAFPPEFNVPVRGRVPRDAALEQFDKLIRTEYTHNTRFTETRPSSLRALGDFYTHQIRKAIREMQSAEFADTVRLWMLYNCAVVVRDGDTLFSFDLVEQYEVHPEDFPEWDWLLENLDAAFFSHVHGDHYQPHVAERLRENGVPVVTWETTDPGPHTIGNIRYHIHAGAQGASPNNNYEVVSPSGVVFYHVGDQSFYKDIKTVEPQVHVHFNGYANMAHFMTPHPLALVPIHMYELHHSGSGRLMRYGPTHHFYDSIEGYNNVMLWGEGVNVEPDKMQPIATAVPHDGAVPAPDDVKDDDLVRLFNAMPEEYAIALSDLLKSSVEFGRKGVYQRERMEAFDALDRLLMSQAPQAVTAGNVPTTAEFDGIRRLYAFCTAKTVREILDAPPVEKGIRAWHLYRSGWMFKEGDLLFGVNAKFPPFLDPSGTTAPRDALFGTLSALFICGNWDADWVARELPDQYPNMEVVNPSPTELGMASEPMSGETAGIKWRSFPAVHDLGAPISLPTSQFIITTPRGLNLFFPGDATNLTDLPKTGTPIDIAFVGLHHYCSVPEHPLAMQPMPKLLVPDDHCYDFGAHEYFGRYSRFEPRWRVEEMDELWEYQLFWGESLTYSR